MEHPKRNSARRQSMRMAFCGMAAALSVVLMLTGSLIPIMTYVSPLLSALILLPVMLEFGRKDAWLCWLAAALIVMLLGIDREAALFYVFFGYYPIVKWQIDKIRSRRLALLFKTGLFTVSAGVMYALICFVFRLDAVLAEFGEMGTVMTVLFFVLLVVCMLIYDRLLLPMMLLYDRKLKPKLHLH